MSWAPERTNRSRSFNIYESITVDSYGNDTTNETMKPAKNPRGIITRESLLNGINEKGLSKDTHFKIKHFPGETTENIFEEAEQLVKNNPDTLIDHAETNDLTKGKNLLNNVKKDIKSVKCFLHK